MAGRPHKVMLALAVAGLGVATYLTYIHYAGIKPLCTAGGSCLKVQTSVYSKLDGVPVALIGAVGYTLILFTLLAPQREGTRLITMLLTSGGFAFSLYLTYREVFSIHAICEWCVSSAGIMTLLEALAIYRFLRGDPLPASAPSAEVAQQPAPLAKAGR